MTKHYHAEDPVPGTLFTIYTNTALGTNMRGYVVESYIAGELRAHAKNEPEECLVLTRTLAGRWLNARGHDMRIRFGHADTWTNIHPDL